MAPSGVCVMSVVAAMDPATGVCAVLGAVLVLVSLALAAVSIVAAVCLRGLAGCLRVYVVDRQTGRVDILRPGLALTRGLEPSDPEAPPTKTLMEPEDADVEQVAEFGA